MAPFPLAPKRSSTFPTLCGLSPPSSISSPQQSRPTRTQRALSRLSRFRLSSIRDSASPVVPPAAPWTTPDPHERPVKQLRRQSRSFSAFFSSSFPPASPSAPSFAPATAPGPLASEDGSPAMATKRSQLKRTISYPVLQHASSPIDTAPCDWWGRRDATIRIEVAAAGESTYAAPPPQLQQVAFPRLLPTTPYGGGVRTRYAESDDSLVLVTPTWSIHLDSHSHAATATAAPEISRFSSSTEDESRLDMSVSSCGSVAPSPCAVLDVFAAAPLDRASTDSALDLDFALESVVPLSSPPSPEMYRHQPVVMHGCAGEDAAMSSPTPAPRAHKWFLGTRASSSSSSSHSGRDVLDPLMAFGFSYAATPALPSRAPTTSALTPPPTPRLAPTPAETPSPFLLPRLAGAEQSLYSLALEELTTEMEKVAPVVLPCGLELPSSVSPSSAPNVPFPYLASSVSPPSTPQPARPDTPTPYAPQSYTLSPHRPLRRVPAPLLTTGMSPRSPTPLPRAYGGRTTSSSTVASSYVRTPLTASASSPLFSPAMTTTTSSSFFSPSTPTSPASSAPSASGEPEKARRRRPVLVTHVAPAENSPYGWI